MSDEGGELPCMAWLVDDDGHIPDGHVPDGRDVEPERPLNDPSEDPSNSASDH